MFQYVTVVTELINTYKFYDGEWKSILELVSVIKKLSIKYIAKKIGYSQFKC